MRGEERMRQVTIRVDPDLWAWVEATVLADHSRKTTQSSMLEACRKAPASEKAYAPPPTDDPANLIGEAADALKTAQRVLRQAAKRIVREREDAARI